MEKFPPVDRIFHPSDFSEASEIAFAHALKFSLAEKSKLFIMHVAGDEEVPWSDFPGVRETLHRWGLLPEKSRKADIRDLGINVSKVIGKKRNPLHSALDFLETHHADLIVLATHQHEGKTRWPHGSIAEPIARASHEMTLFVPHHVKGFVSAQDGSVSLRNILVPIDMHPSPQRAVDGAVRVASELAVGEVEFTLLHVGDPTDAPAVRQMASDGWTWKKQSLEGDVVEGILQVAIDTSADLIVMTTTGHHGFLDALRGSITERVLRQAPCPLLAIPRGA